jgi:hypothetical protein
MAEECGIPSEFHAWAFNYASGFVHPSAVFLIRHLTQGAEGAIEISSGDQFEESRFALRIAHCLILNAVDLRLKYWPSEALTAALGERKNDFKKIWGYTPPI